MNYSTNKVQVFCWTATIKFPWPHEFPDLSLTLGLFPDLYQIPWNFHVSRNSRKVVIFWSSIQPHMRLAGFPLSCHELCIIDDECMSLGSQLINFDNYILRARAQCASVVNLLLSVRTSYDVIAPLWLAACFCLVQSDCVCAVYLMITEAFFNDFCFFVLFAT